MSWLRVTTNWHVCLTCVINVTLTSPNLVNSNNRPSGSWISDGWFRKQCVSIVCGINCMQKLVLLSPTQRASRSPDKDCNFMINLMFSLRGRIVYLFFFSFTCWRRRLTRFRIHRSSLICKKSGSLDMAVEIFCNASGVQAVVLQQTHAPSTLLVLTNYNLQAVTCTINRIFPSFKLRSDEAVRQRGMCGLLDWQPRGFSLEPINISPLFFPVNESSSSFPEPRPTINVLLRSSPPSLSTLCNGFTLIQTLS
jgi:hypothetical protein